MIAETISFSMNGGMQDSAGSVINGLRRNAVTRNAFIAGIDRKNMKGGRMVKRKVKEVKKPERQTFTSLITDAQHLLLDLSEPARVLVMWAVTLDEEARAAIIMAHKVLYEKEMED